MKMVKKITAVSLALMLLMVLGVPALAEGEAPATDLTLATEVINNSGAAIPDTGGIGTTIFTVIGVVLMVGAVVLFIAKKRSTRD